MNENNQELIHTGLWQSHTMVISLGVDFSQWKGGQFTVFPLSGKEGMNSLLGGSTGHSESSREQPESVGLREATKESILRHRSLTGVSERHGSWRSEILTPILPSEGHFATFEAKVVWDQARRIAINIQDVALPPLAPQVREQLNDLNLRETADELYPHSESTSRGFRAVLKVEERDPDSKQRRQATALPS